MKKDVPPPSISERNRLVTERKKDLPRPAPTLRPAGSIGAVIDAAAAKRRTDAAHDREKRIFSIDQALSSRKGQAKESLSRVKDKGFAKAHAAKAAAKTGKQLSR